MSRVRQSTAHLHWVRADDDVIISGTTVQAGKLVRMRADWQPSPSYMGPEIFYLRQRQSYFARLLRDREALAGFEADFDGPPTTHSRDAWQAGASTLTNQARWIFTDSHKNSSSVLTVSNVAFYTSTPRFEAIAHARGPVPGALGTVGLTARAGNAKTVFHVGATTDPLLRIGIMVPWGEGEMNLREHVERLRADQGRPLSPQDWAIYGRDARSYLEPEPGPWVPVFENGETELVLEVDEQNHKDVTIVPTRTVPTEFTFRTAFAIRIVDSINTANYVISDIVTVENNRPTRSIPRDRFGFRA
jgi:hypothetical protein